MPSVRGTARGTRTTARPSGRRPSLRYERELLRGGARWLAAVDEVGRGSLAGPVSVGVVLVDLSVGTAPTGLRDSKLLTPAHREALAPKLRRWAPAWAVGHASAGEIDAYGILPALRLAQPNESERPEEERGLETDDELMALCDTKVSDTRLLQPVDVKYREGALPPTLVPRQDKPVGSVTGKPVALK